MGSSEVMKPYQVAKEAGLDGLGELAELSEQSEQTLNNWFKNPNKRKLFDCVVLGTAVMKRQLTDSPLKYWAYGAARIEKKHALNSERYSDDLLKFARECLERFPAFFKHPDHCGRGTPQAVIEEINNNKFK
ncbi:hypothetical protein BCS71_25570 (plasmid) [Vibrio lentus]|uniref:hypothetical protein n=1 Tax=Vibrio lentus TaxID=136468 RepID=UPI0038A2B913